MKRSHIEKRYFFIIFPVFHKFKLTFLDQKDQNFSRPLFKNEPQVLKCYTKKVEKPAQTGVLAQGEKTEKNDEKENAATLEEKLSNVSTSFSSKEKPMEEELATPVLHPVRRTGTQTGEQAVFQMTIILPNETKSLEIFQVLILIIL